MVKWDKTLWLLTEQELDQLEDGTILMCINYMYHKKSPTLNRDTRYGLLAYGLTEELIEKQGLTKKVFLWRIKGVTFDENKFR
jgi:hypothetical protein